MNTALTLQIGGDISKLRSELNKANGLMGGFQKQMLNVGKVFAGAFVLDKAIEFGKQVFNVTAEFQKFEAVLTNTLGHNGAANAALNQIIEFAAKTPFQVNELTASFVKLANQGFVPTRREMQSLGDLAAAMGKSFDQLTEAIIDAQTGEFERLKEFGIRASKQGDKVTFTFKGVKKQVDFTADSIREYILSLGDVQGVTGGMEAQSKTLGGGLSNLKDSFEQLQLAMGKAAESGGLFSGALDLIAGAVNGMKNLFQVGESKEELEKTIAFFKEAMIKSDLEGNTEAWQMAIEAMSAAQKKLDALVEGEAKLAEIQKNKTTPATKAQTQSVKDLMDQWDRQHSISSKKFNESDQITTKTGSDFLFDSGAMTDTMGAFNRIHNALMAVNGDIKINSTAWDEWVAGVSARTQQLAETIETDFTPVIHNALSGLGQALGDAITGAGNLGDSLLKVLGGVITQLGEMILAAGIGVEAFKKSLQSLNGVAAIAAGIALIALGSAVSRGISGLGGSAGSTGGPPGRTPSEMNVKVGGRIRGYDLALVNEKESYRRGRVG